MSYTSAPETHIQVGSICSMDLRNTAAYSGTLASTAWPAANLAIFVPFSVGAAVTVYEGWVATGTLTTSTNMRIGIYATDGTQLFTTADITVATASVVVNSSGTTDYLLQKGTYYMAISSDGTRNILASPDVSGLHEARGCMEQTGLTGAALPSPATFAVYTRAFLPIFGLNLTSVAL